MLLPFSVKLLFFFFLLGCNFENEIYNVMDRSSVEDRSNVEDRAYVCLSLMAWKFTTSDVTIMT